MPLRLTFLRAAAGIMSYVITGGPYSYDPIYRSRLVAPAGWDTTNYASYGFSTKQWAADGMALDIDPQVGTCKGHPIPPDGPRNRCGIWKETDSWCFCDARCKPVMDI
jgi:hypothetical protein